MILRNSGKCPQCKWELVSRYRHDCVECSCGESFVDGGRVYLRRSEGLIDTSATTEDNILTIRERFEWGTRGKSGLEDLEYIKLENLSDSHIRNIIKNVRLSIEIKEVFEQELKFREALDGV